MSGAAAVAEAPEREFKGLDYSNDKVDEYRAALDSGVNINSRECENSSPVDFLYLSTIRGGRKTKKMSAGGCGCGLVGGVRYRKRRYNKIRGGNEGEDPNANETYNYPNSGNAEAAEAASVRAEPAEPGTEPGYPNSGDPAMTGGCFTCKKGIKNITHIYSTIHIIIPTLYSKYKKGVSLKAAKPAKPAKSPRSRKLRV
jgi:hypothetical protein